jgi:hypothetical protein
MANGFDELLADLEGTGWYQNRIAWFLIAPLFFVTPFAFLNQIFVLYIPGLYSNIVENINYLFGITP